MTEAGHVVLTVRRSGGFAGLVEERSVDLDSDDDRAPELRRLVERLGIGSLGWRLRMRLRPATPMPDMFGYAIQVGNGPTVQLLEQQLTPDLRRLIDLVLVPRAGGECDEGWEA